MLTFQHVRFDQGEADEYYNVLLGIVGDFTITIAGKTLYTEQEFCLVEFAMQLASWWQRVQLVHRDFGYESVESDDGVLVWIRAGDGRWRVGALDQEYEEYQAFSLETIGEAVEKYTQQLQRELHLRFGLDLAAFIRRYQA